MSDPIRDIVEALNAHYGEPLPMNTGSPDAWSELIASWIEPVIREREAAAWDAGYYADADVCVGHDCATKPNPYRDTE